MQYTVHQSNILIILKEKSSKPRRLTACYGLRFCRLGLEFLWRLTA